jgi:hypothetical protein
MAYPSRAPRKNNINTVWKKRVTCPFAQLVISYLSYFFKGFRLVSQGFPPQGLAKYKDKGVCKTILERNEACAVKFAVEE